DGSGAGEAAPAGPASANPIQIVMMIKTIGAITVVVPRNFTATLFIGGSNAFSLARRLRPRCDAHHKKRKKDAPSPAPSPRGKRRAANDPDRPGAGAGDRGRGTNPDLPRPCRARHRQGQHQFGGHNDIL